MNEAEIEKKVKRAEENHKNGCNCAQSVLCAFSDVLGADEKLLYQISEGFGLGMGRMETCGAVTAMFMALGLATSNGDPSQGNTKPVTMKRIKALGKEFEEKNGSLICRELKGVDTGRVLRSCSGCIEDAVRILARNL